MMRTAWFACLLFIGVVGCGGSGSRPSATGAPITSGTIDVADLPGITLTAQPASIAAGSAATLTWASEEAISVSLDNGIGPVSLSSSQQVTPSATTTYTATAVGTAGTATAAVTVTVTPFTAIPASNHVILVLEENHSYESVRGNPSMPLLNSWADHYGLATQYYANEHASIPNYFWLTAGQPVTFDDNTKLSFDVDNIVRHLLAAGKTWKSYAESLPHAGYTGYNVGLYVKRHNPFPYFTDVAFSTQKYNIVPFTQFATDLQNGNLPNFSFVAPNLLHSAHDGTLAMADKWLQTNIAPLLSTPAFQAGGDGLLIITFDESNDEDCRPTPTCDPAAVEHGGRVMTVLVGPKVKEGSSSTNLYMHENLLRTIGVSLGLTSLPGAANQAASMSDLFQP
jgi:phosphatidylinositol-3-phosphatase